MCLAFHPVSPSYKSYEAQDGLSELDTRPDAWDAMSLVFALVVSLLVKNCQYPRDPSQPARRKKNTFLGMVQDYGAVKKFVQPGGMQAARQFFLPQSLTKRDTT